MKPFFLLILLCSIASFAQPSINKNFDEFEKSLMLNGSAESEQPSLDKFEQSLMAESSDMEPIYRARDNLLESLKEKDYSQVLKLMDTLSTMETRMVIPLSSIEKEVIYIEIQKYDKLLDYLVEFYRGVYDTSRYEQNVVFASQDGLEIYLQQRLRERTEFKNEFYSLNEEVLKKLPKRKRDKLKMLLLLPEAYKSEKYETIVLHLAESLVSEPSNDPDVPWIKNCIYLPLSRMDPVEFMLQRRKEQKENIIQEKLYSGGFGLNALFISLGGASGSKNFYNRDRFEVENLPINIEIYAQIKRFAILGELVNNGMTGSHTYEVGLGFVAFDSRYLKVRPYIAWGKSFMEMRPKDDEWVAYGNDSGPMTFTAAVNVDFKFITAFLFYADHAFSSFSLVGKLGFSNIDFDHKYVKGETTSLFFNLGLGIYLW